MRVRLDDLMFNIGDPLSQGNDVQVDFEYERLERSEVKFFMSAFVGKDIYEIRFCLRVIYILDFEDDSDFDNDSIMIQKAIDAIIPTFTQLIVLIDTAVKEDELERH